MGSSESFKLEPILTVKKEDDGYAASVIIREVDPTTDFLTTDVTDYYEDIRWFSVLNLKQSMKW